MNMYPDPKRLKATETLNLMKLLIFASVLVFALGSGHAQEHLWGPSLGHTQLPIWPKELPDPQPALGPKTVQTIEGSPVAGRPWMTNTIAVYVMSLSTELPGSFKWP
jgi:hypothetical protein